MYNQTKRNLTTILAISFTLFASVVAEGQALLRWNPANTNPPSGGDGDWIEGGKAWFDGAQNVFWNNANRDDAEFGTKKGRVELRTAITARRLSFTVDGYRLTGGRILTLAGNSPRLTVEGIDTKASIENVIAGNTLLTKAGFGTLLLSGQNTFSGGFDLREGTVIVQASSTGSITSGPLGTGLVRLLNSRPLESIALLADSGGEKVANTIQVLASQGAVHVGSNDDGGRTQYTGNLMLESEVRLTSPSIIVHGVIFTGEITGAGGVRKVGLGNLTIRRDGGNTYTGNTRIEQGTLFVINKTGSITGTGTVTVDGGSLVASGAISGAILVTKGALFPSDSLLAPATLKAGGDVTFGADGIFDVILEKPAPSKLIVQGNLVLGSEDTMLFPLLRPDLMTAPEVGDKFFIIENKNPVTGHFRDLEQDKTLDLTFMNMPYRFKISYFGNAANNAVEGGNDVVLYNVAIPEPSAVLSLTVGIAGLGGWMAHRRRNRPRRAAPGPQSHKASWRRCGLLSACSAGLLLAHTAQAQQLSWSADGLKLGGTGDWTVSGKNWFQAGLQEFRDWPNDRTEAIFEGTAGTVTVLDAINAGGLLFRVDGYTLTAAGDALIRFTRLTTELTFRGQTTLSAPLAGDTTLFINGDGTLRMAGKNTYSGGSRIFRGTILLDMESATAANGSITSGPLGTGSVQIMPSLTTTASVLTTKAMTVPYAITVTQRPNSTAALGGQQTQGTAVFSGEIVLEGGVSLRSSGSGLNGIVEFSNRISGSGPVTKVGSGRIFLSRKQGNTYSGGTRIDEGTLVVCSDRSVLVSATGGGPVTVNQGGTLRGDARIDGPITVNSGGTILAGFPLDEKTPGILEVGNLTLKQGAKLAAILTSTMGLEEYSQIMVRSGSTIDLGNSTLDLLLDYTPVVGDRLRIIDYLDPQKAVTGIFDGLMEGGTTDLMFQNNTYRFKISYKDGTGNDVVLTALTGVPEPGSLTLLSLLGIGVVCWFRRRQAMRGA